MALPFGLRGPGGRAACPRPQGVAAGRHHRVGHRRARVARFRLWHNYGIQSEVYEYNDQPGGRIRTLRGHFDDGQLIEEHAEFINPEHTATLGLAKRFGLTLDNTDHYPEQNQDQLSLQLRRQAVVAGAPSTATGTASAGSCSTTPRSTSAPWPTLYTHSTKWGRRWDRMSVSEWVDANVPGGIGGDFGQLCISAVLDEYGGPPEEQSALNLVYLLGGDASTKSGNQPKSAPELGGADEKWHIHGGNDQLITGILDRLPAGASGSGRGWWRSGTGQRPLHRDVAQGPRHHGRSSPTTWCWRFRSRRCARSTWVMPGSRRCIGARSSTEPLGSNAKMFLQFTDRVWDAGDKTGNAYCAGVVQGAWDAAGYQTGAAGILAALPGGRIGTDWGQRTTSALPRQRAGRDGARLPRRSSTRSSPGCDSAYNGKSYYVWSAGDPHIRGAYSYLKVGQYTGFNGIQGRREGNLHFAGEHTSVNFQGYIEGALAQRPPLRERDRRKGLGSGRRQPACGSVRTGVTRPAPRPETGIGDGGNGQLRRCRGRHQAAGPDLQHPAANLVMYAGASGDFNVIHWNERVAKSVGPAQRHRARHVHDGRGRPGRDRLGGRSGCGGGVRRTVLRSGARCRTTTRAPTSRCPAGSRASSTTAGSRSRWRPRPSAPPSSPRRGPIVQLADLAWADCGLTGSE